MLKKICLCFSQANRLAILNAILIAIAVGFNTYLQAFCIPTTWAAIVLAICFANTVFYPILQRTRFAPITAFINGIALCVFIYCVLFLGHINLLGFFLIIVGLGLVTFIPHFFVAQLIWENLISPVNNICRYCFLSAIIMCLFAAGYTGYKYKQALSAIQRFKQSGYTTLDKTFMTEKILGMHFIYHTQICEYDGWRPPMHEPALVVGLWLSNSTDPLKVDLKTRLALYKKFFPERKYKYDCSCAVEYSKDYHTDKLWK